MDAEENEKIKVDIFNNQYLVKCSDNLSEADIRVLSSFVDQLMRQISRKGYDQLTAAILVALNLAETDVRRAETFFGFPPPFNSRHR